MGENIDAEIFEVVGVAGNPYIASNGLGADGELDVSLAEINDES
jgi:hypothetical protein